MGPGEPFGVGANIWGKNIGWATKEIIYFLHPQNTLKRYSIGEKNNFYGLFWSA